MSSQENNTTEYTCKVQGCKSRPLKTSKTFENHMKKQHPDIDVGESSSTPTPDTSPSTPSTPDHTPATTTSCSSADSPPLPEQSIDEMYNDNEWMEAVAEEVELMSEMQQMTEEEMDDEGNKDEVVNKYKEKIERFKTIADKKSSVVKALKEVKDNLVHDILLRKEVETQKEKKIDELENIISEMKNQMKVVRERNLVILVDQKKMKRERKEYNETLKELREINNGLIKDNATFKIKLKRKDDLIEGLREVSEIEIETEDDSVVFDKETSGPVCLTCDKRFPVKRALDQHMQAKHNQGECPLCDETFPLGAALEEHTDECMDRLQDKTHECPECKNTFLTKRALKTHSAKHNNFNTKGTKCVCPNCKMIINNVNELNNHKQKCTLEDQQTKEKSKIVCKHWRRGTCNRGDSCGFSHVGHQNTTTPEGRITKLAGYTPACKHGSSCEWLAKGKCSFFHINVGVQQPKMWRQNEERDQHQKAPINTQRRPEFQLPKVWRKNEERDQHNKAPRNTHRRPECRHGADCRKFPDCPFLHSLEDFPNLLKANQQKRSGMNSFRRQ